ncbi:MAG: hypothetical protein NT166_24585 [Candidatus Aminicenantes bacterium]|nr:hypothetical protein [Candidatus Aminicenantes bacterium]
MAYESQMINLAEGAIKLHGELEEVLFLKNNNKDSVLVFSDGAVLPVEHGMHGFKGQTSHRHLVIFSGLW